MASLNLPNFPDVSGQTVSADKQLQDFLIAVRITLEKLTAQGAETAILAAATPPQADPSIPSGAKMYFYQDAAPTGWTIDATVADVLLAVKGGSNAYNVAGGNIVGSWTPTTHSHTGPSHTHTMGSHIHSTTAVALTIAQLPSHTHTVTTYNIGSGGTTKVAYANGTSPGSVTSNATGSGDTHSHGNTGSTDPGDTNAGGTGSTGLSSAPSTDRPYGAVGIVATKD
jgi:hypothetical protein